MKKIYTDNLAIFNVLGGILNNPALIEKYDMEPEDFGETFYQIIYKASANLYAKGLEEITVLDIDGYLRDHPKSYQTFNENGGVAVVTNAKTKTNPSSFEYHYDIMKKMSLLTSLGTIVDLDFMYDPEHPDPNVRERQRAQLLEWSIQDIMSEVDARITKIRDQHMRDTAATTGNVADGVDDLILSLMENPDLGVPLYGKYINTITRGCRTKKFYLRSAPTGAGKAIPDYTVIPTPSGFKTVGEIKVGDKLFGRDGQPTTVLAVYPQEEEKEIYKITFKDGRVAESCEDHLWTYSYKSHREWKEKTVPLKEIYNKGEADGYTADGSGYRFKIPVNSAVNYPTKTLPLSPYALGALLGDGSLRESSSNKALTLSSQDFEIAEKVAREINCTPNRLSEKNFDWNFKLLNPKGKRKLAWVSEIFSNLPELIGAKSESKFIPEIYLTASVEQRLELLRGLLDTDGSIDARGRVRFTTISKRLVKDVANLVHSLGGVCSVSEDRRSDKYITGVCYNVSIQFNNEFKKEIFSLKRKKEVAERLTTKELKKYNPIVSIEKTGNKTTMTCFTVDASDSLFLMNDYIVTHNTRTMIADATSIATTELYNLKTNKWESTGEALPVSFIVTELDKEEVQTMCLAFLSGVNENHILRGTYQPGELDRVRKAAKLLTEGLLYITELPDFNMDDIEMAIRRNIREFGTRQIFFDYIHSSLKIFEEISRKTKGMSLREDQVLFMMSIRLKDIANELDVFIMSATQVNASYTDETAMPDQNMLRGAKSIADE